MTNNLLTLTHHTSKQEVFDFVIGFLSKQNFQSLNHDGTCAYRGTNERKCAVGCLIPDEFYDERIESLAISDLIFLDRNSDKEFGSASEYLPLLTEHERLLEGLQAFHDNARVWQDNDYAKSKLDRIAKTFNLDSSVVNKFANR